MKLRIINPLSQVVLTSIVLVAISIACSSSKSAESPSVEAANASTNQPSTSPISSANQSRPGCALNMSHAPVLHGLRLGMTPDEVLALFPGSKDDAEVRSDLSRPPKLGASSFVIRPGKYESKVEQVNQITFSVLDGRISKINIGYNGPEWPHVDKFVEKFVEGTNLPAVDQWEKHVGLDNQAKTLACTDFSIRVFAGGPGGNINHVLMQDLEADKKLKERRKKAQEQASPTPGQ